MPIDPLHRQDLQFFDSASSCISHYDHAHWSKKAFSFLQSCSNTFLYLLETVCSLFQRTEAHMQQWSKERPLTKSRLIVCLHGYKASPHQFKPLVDCLRERDLSGTDVYIPPLSAANDPKLHVIAEPIVQKIVQWASSRPQDQEDHELVLIGISNGGRIARAIEVALAGPGCAGTINKLRVVTIVGACKGSSLVNRVRSMGLSWILPKNLAEEMATDSRSSVAQDIAWRAGLSRQSSCETDYTWIASPHDWLVPNFDSTLPEAYPRKGCYAIVRGHGHFSIVNAVARPIADILLPPAKTGAMSIV